MLLNRALLRQARIESVAVELSDLMPAGFFLFHSLFSDTVPDWLQAELASEGVTLRLERTGCWILASLDE